jgi:outer membrane protein assembly factor BamB
MRTVALAILTATALVPGAPARADNWPQWRGPSATGISTEKDLPLTWGGKDGANVLWKADLGDVDEGHSSPIVWGDRVFVTVSKKFDHRVLCFAVADGKPLWQAAVAPGPYKKDGYRNGNVASPTPATDGKRVYALFGTAAWAAVDCADGKVIWEGPLEKTAFDVCLGSSPVLCEGLLVLLSGLTDGKSNITGFDPATGKAKWSTPLPKVGYTHSTPAIVTVGGKTQLVCTVNQKDAAILGVDPATGRIMWSAPGDGDTASPAVGGGVVYADSGRGGGGFAIDLPKPDDKAEAATTAVQVPLKWQLRVVPMDLGSPTIFDQFIYRVGGGSRLVCMKLQDGTKAYEDKLTGGSPWACPVATADGRLYFASTGVSYVVQAGGEFKVLAKNDLGEPSQASPAVANGKIYLRSKKSLYCIGGK